MGVDLDEAVGEYCDYVFGCGVGVGENDQAALQRRHGGLARLVNYGMAEVDLRGQGFAVFYCVGRVRATARK